MRDDRPPRASGSRRPPDAPSTGSAGDRTSPSGSGARSARTTREYGTAWDYFPHDHARSRAYRWGEDGLLGISDNHQRLCFALALWNGRDPILKERLFGLTGTEGNHGEDVKEYYFYLDSTPTHSYMKGLYKYPQAEFPYGRARGREPAARAASSPSSSCSTPACSTTTATSTWWSSTRRRRRTTSSSRSASPTAGPRRRTLHLLPTLWFRNTWSWDHGAPAPAPARRGQGVITVGEPGAPRPRTASTARTRRELLFTENETNAAPALRQREPRPLRQGRHPRVRRARQAERGEPGPEGTQGGAALRARRAGRRDGAPSGCGWWTASRSAPFGELRRDLRPAAEGGRRVLRHRHPRQAERRRAAGDAAGHRRACSGASSSTTTT